MKVRFPILVALVAALTIAAPSSAAIVTTPMSDPNVPVSQGSPLATLFQNPDTVAQVVDLNTNYSTTLTVTDGSRCPTVSIKRGTSRYRCTVPAGGAVLYATFALAATTYTTAIVNGQVAGNVAYLTTPAPFVPTVYTITCERVKTWGYWVLPTPCLGA